MDHLEPTAGETATLELGTDFPDIREGVRAVCRDFPGAYWRELERTDAYAEEFVQAMTRAGYLAALIPEEYGGAACRCAPAA